MTETLVIIERDPTNARQLAELLEREGRTIVVLGGLGEIIPADASAVFMNVQSLVTDREYRADAHDLEALAEALTVKLADVPDATIGVYATIPNRAYSLMEVLNRRGVKACYRDFIRVTTWPEFSFKARGSPR